MGIKKRSAASQGVITRSLARKGGETDDIVYHHTVRADSTHMGTTGVIPFAIARPRTSGSSWPTSKASFDILLTNWPDWRSEDEFWDDIGIVDGSHQVESACNSMWPRQYSGSHSSVDAMPNFRGDDSESREESRKCGGYSKYARLPVYID